jgi:hypothetical protein
MCGTVAILPTPSEMGSVGQAIAKARLYCGFVAGKSVHRRELLAEVGGELLDHSGFPWCRMASCRRRTESCLTGFRRRRPSTGDGALFANVLHCIT